jgi:exodeoxyribonuclease VII large subunit
LRAPTPTAAAELATPDIADFALAVLEAGERTRRQMRLVLDRRRSDTYALVQRIDRVAPHAQLEQQRSRCKNLCERLETQMRMALLREHSRLEVRTAELKGLGLRTFDRARSDLAAKRLMSGASVLGVLAEARGLLAVQSSRLHRVATADMNERQHQVASLAVRLEALNPNAVLERGFAVIETAQGADVTSIQQVMTGSHIRARLQDGTIDATVDSVQARSGAMGG